MGSSILIVPFPNTNTMVLHYGQANPTPVAGSIGYSNWWSPNTDTASMLWVSVTATTTSATTTIDVATDTSYTGSATNTATALSLSVSSGTTGFFQDTSDTISLTAGGGSVYYSVTRSASGTGFLTATVGMKVDSSQGTKVRTNCGPYGGAGGAVFFSFGLSQTTSNEAQAQAKLATSVHLQGLVVYVDANGRTRASTVSTRINAVTGTVAASITGSTTGIFSDLTHTDAVAAGALVDMALTVGTGSGTVSFVPGADIDVVSTSGDTNPNAFYLVNLLPVLSMTANVAEYFALAVSNVSMSSTTESSVQQVLGFATKLSHLAVSCTVWQAPAFTWSLRVNGATANQSVSVAGTGYSTDVSHTDTVGPTDLVNTTATVTSTSATLTIVQGAVTEAEMVLSSPIARRVGKYIY